jgi:hypothetical protein
VLQKKILYNKWINKFGGCLKKTFIFKKQESDLWPLYSLYPNGHEVGKVFCGLHEDPLACSYEVFLETGFWIVEV